MLGPSTSAIPDAGTILSVSSKRTNANGEVEYLVRIATGVDRSASEQPVQEPIHTEGKKAPKKKKVAVDTTSSWSRESAVPLYLIEQFEEKLRRWAILLLKTVFDPQT